MRRTAGVQQRVHPHQVSIEAALWIDAERGGDTVHPLRWKRLNRRANSAANGIRVGRSGDVGTSHRRRMRVPHREGDFGNDSGGSSLFAVCGMTVDPKRAAGHAEHQGKTYSFCGAGCLKRFTADPEPFVARTLVSTPVGRALPGLPHKSVMDLPDASGNRPRRSGKLSDLR